MNEVAGSVVELEEDGFIPGITQNNADPSKRTSWSDNCSEDDEPLINKNAESPKMPSIHCSGGSSYFSKDIHLAEEYMKRKLKFFFMNPIEKWEAKRQIPYKFLVQVVKIVFVTIQLCLFAHSRYNHVNYSWDNRISFSHLFLKGWDTTREVNAYPPALGPLAVYKKDTFFESLDFALTGYANLSDTIGSYSYTSDDNVITPPVLCFYQYKEGIIFGFNESYMFNSEIDTRCINVNISNAALDSTESRSTFSIQTYLKDVNIEVNFAALVKAELFFSLKTVNFKAAGPITPPDCYKFDIVISYDNSDNDGQMLIDLTADPFRLVCQGDVEYINDNRIDFILRSLLNILVIAICVCSLILCSRAVYRAQLLKYETMRFFREVYDKELSVEGRWEFWNLWYIMIIINDVLLIFGSAIKERIERKQSVGDQWNVCSVFLGTGNLLVWFGVLRYLGFFKTYNVVILTLKKAFPKVARFLLCAILIYAGFTFCGWIVLGPYHMKFRSLASTSECLFALINGDDMYATFSIMSYKSPMLWWYSRIYLYTFISLFIYVVLSLFISVIADSYETIKKYYEEGFPKTDVQQFLAKCSEEPISGVYQDWGDTSDSSFQETFSKFCCCKIFCSIFSNQKDTFGHESSFT